MQYVVTMWLIVTCIAGFDFDLPDGDELKLQIDPTNKESIRIKIDGKEEIFIPLVKPPPTLQEVFKLPSDLIAGLHDSAEGISSSIDEKLSDTGQHTLKDLFAEKTFVPKNQNKFDGQKFQQQVESYARELRSLVDDNKKAANIDNIFSETRYQEDKIHDFFDKSIKTWENDPDASAIMRKTPIMVEFKEFKDFFTEIRKQKNDNDPKFDLLEEYLKTIRDYNSGLFNRDQRII